MRFAPSAVDETVLITCRTTLHPILHSRIGPDQFVSRMARLREDPRFRAVQPESFDESGAMDHGANQMDAAADEELDEALELWFDWSFVDFWKNHYCEHGPASFLHTAEIDEDHADTIQRSIAVDPDAVRGPASELFPREMRFQLMWF